LATSGAGSKTVLTIFLTFPWAAITHRLQHSASRTAFGKPGTRSRLPWEAAAVVLGHGGDYRTGGPRCQL